MEDAVIKKARSFDLNLFSSIEQFSQMLVSSVITDSQKNLDLESGIQKIVSLIDACRGLDGTVYVVGNGGSAAIASHVVIDLLNMVKVRAMALLDPAVTTCLSNDYGYEGVYSRQLQQFVRPGDVLIAISSSGKSKNILNAVAAAKSRGVGVITLSGFGMDNPLRLLGDINLWLNSNDYGQVEIGHAFILHNVTDRLKYQSVEVNYESVSDRGMRVQGEHLSPEVVEQRVRG